MLNENSLKFSNIKKRIIEEDNEVMFPENDFLKFKLTPAEKIRYEENSKLSETVFEEFNSLINGDIDLDSIKERSERLMEKLSTKQQNIIRKITKKIINGGGVVLEGLSSNFKHDTLQDKYKKYGNSQAVSYFYEGVSSEIASKIKFQDIKLLPWGAVVVYVNDEETMNALYGPEDDKVKAQGFFKNGLFDRQVDSSVNNYPYINAQFKRTVYIRTDNISDKRVKEIEKHELFHELYKNILSDDQEIRYERYSDRALFGEIKNESMAYLMSEEWQYKLNPLSTSLRCHEGENERAVTSFNRLYDYIVDYRLKEEFQKDNPEKFLAIMGISEKNLELIPDEKKENIKKQAMLFLQEIVYCLREVVRLNYLESNKFEEAKKAILTAQSFKEMRYKLSRIEENTPLEPPIHFDLKNLSQEDNLNKALSFLENAIVFRLAIKNLDDLIIALKKRKEEIKKSNNEVDKKHIEWIDNKLRYYDNSLDRIINIGAVFN